MFWKAPFRHRSCAALPRQFTVLGVVILGLVLQACSATDREVSSTSTVSQVIDGDTIVIDFAGRNETVRLLGIDTPETVDPNRPVQCFGEEASDHLRALLPSGTPVRVVRDVEARDRFGRLLVYVFRAADDLFINAVLLQEGLADLAIYAPNVAYRAAFEHALATAQTRNAGLWAACGGADVALDPPPVTAPAD